MPLSIAETSGQTNQRHRLAGSSLKHYGSHDHATIAKQFGPEAIASTIPLVGSAVRVDGFDWPCIVERRAAGIAWAGEGGQSAQLYSARAYRRIAKERGLRPSFFLSCFRLQEYVGQVFGL